MQHGTTEKLLPLQKLAVFELTLEMLPNDEDVITPILPNSLTPSSYQSGKIRQFTREYASVKRIRAKNNYCNNSSLSHKLLAIRSDEFFWPLLLPQIRKFDGEIEEALLRQVTRKRHHEN